MPPESIRCLSHLGFCAWPPQLHCPCPQARWEQHCDSRPCNYGSGGDSCIQEPSARVGPNGDAQHAEAKVGREDPASEAVFGIELQECRREHPDGRAAKVREGRPETSLPHVAGPPNQGVANRAKKISIENAEAQSVITVPSPRCTDQRSNECA